MSTKRACAIVSAVAIPHNLSGPATKLTYQTGQGGDRNIRQLLLIGVSESLFSSQSVEHFKEIDIR